MSLQIAPPPSKKAQIIYKPKSQIVEKRKLRTKKKKDERKQKEIVEKAKKEKEAQLKKEKLLEIFELYTNTVKNEPLPDTKPSIRKQRADEDIKKQEEEEILLKNIDDVKYDFLTKEEIIDLRKSYDDLLIGDFVLVFQNPEVIPNKPITLKEALEHYDHSLCVVSDDPNMNKDEVTKQRNAFIHAFLALPNYTTQDEEYEKFKKEQQKKQKKQKPNLAKKDEPSKTVNLNNPKDPKEFIMSPQDPNKNMIISQQNVTDLLDTFLSPRQELLMSCEKALKIDLTEPKEYYHIKKKYACGGYLVQEPIPDTDDYDWICSNSPPPDFLTLVRNVVMTKLTRNAMFHTRSFVTSDGKNIIMVLKIDESIIHHEAQKSLVDKQLELGYCDIFSLEPVDSNGRPLRLKPYIRKPINLPPDMEDMPDIEKEDKESGAAVASRARSIYQKLMKMNDNQLQKTIINKQRKMDEVLRKLSKKVRIEIDFNEDILDDVPVPRETWEAYYLYNAYLEEFLSRIEVDSRPPVYTKDKKLKKPDNSKLIRDNIYFLYKLVFRKALGDANETSYEYYKSWLLNCMGLENEDKKQRLQTIWDLLKLDPIPPFMNYYNVNKGDNMGMWRSYEVNEHGKRSTFLNMERLKITYKIIMQNINTLGMIQNKLMDSFFPLHDQFQVYGEFNTPLFKRFYDTKVLNEYSETPAIKKFKNYCLLMADEAEKTDFDTDGSCLKDDLEFKLSRPWYIDIAALRNYFGEKIALYFNFLSFYTIYMLPMAIMGIIAQIVIDNANVDIGNGMKLAFSVIIIVWSTLFIEAWKRKQSVFAIQYGQTDLEESMAERPSFKGKFIRSISNDDLNFRWYSEIRRRFKIFLSYCVSLLIIALVIVCVIFIFILKEYFNTCDCVDAKNPFITVIPSLINSVQITIFNIVYQTVAMKMNDFENHKILQTYENSLVFKIFAFTFVNTFNSLVFLAFFNEVFPALHLCKTGGDEENCFTALSVQMKTLFLVAFVKNIPELLVPLIKMTLSDKKKKKDEKPETHVFLEIDQVIEKELNKTAYATNLEVDGTVEDYMELMIQFGFLCLFAASFPIAYLIAFITNIFEIQVDKEKIMRFKRRPVPEGAADIGTWFIIIDFISFVALFTNAGLISYTSGIVKDNDIQKQMQLFILFVLGFLIIKYIIKTIVPDVPYKSRILLNRHKFVINRVKSGITNLREKELKKSKLVSEIGNIENNKNIGGGIEAEVILKKMQYLREKSQNMKKKGNLNEKKNQTNEPVVPLRG